MMQNPKRIRSKINIIFPIILIFIAGCRATKSSPSTSLTPSTIIPQEIDNAVSEAENIPELTATEDTLLGIESTPTGTPIRTENGQ